ncbi:MAG TPA: hypothetical protein VM716_09375 [Gemmatimonadales bacterium]|nr:hypothetical protein [Gemmatimonadales bacterium]
MSGSRVGGLLILLAFGGAWELRAQTTARELVAKGVQAYRALEYDAAAALLRRGMAPDAAGTLSTSERSQALSYLGATELFRTQRDSAIAAFRDIVELDPRYRPDELIFPPQVTNLFQEVRRATKAVALAVPPQTELRTHTDRLTARVFSSTLANVTVTLAREDGTPVRELYRGPVADSLTVSWDGLTADGARPDDGRYLLRVAPNAPDPTGTALMARQVALDVMQQPADTLPWPAPPTLLPERTGGTPSVRPLAAGLIAAAAAVLLPSIVAHNRDATSARFAVGAAVGIAGVAGFVTNQRGRPIEANVRANTPLKEAWQRKLDDVKEENAKRRSTVRLIVRAGAQTVADRGTR